MLCVHLLILFCGFSFTVESAKILGVFPVPSLSHQIVFRALMLELAKRGHELVIITPNPAFPKEGKPDNITEIDIGESYQILAKGYEDETVMKLERGVIMGLETLFNAKTNEGLFEMSTFAFNLKEVKDLLNDRSQKFDLVFAEGMTNYHLVVSHIFKAPVILFSSFHGCSEHYESMGAVAWHPLYYPNFYRQKLRNLSIWEKINEVYLEWKLFRHVRSYENYENEMLKQRFGPDVPTVQELRKNVQMLFANAHPIFGNNRPVPPSVIYLGAIHMQPVKPLPQDLKTYLDNSTRGVIYVSLGTNVRPSFMDTDLLKAFLTAFEALQYDILWKFDGNNLPSTPKNLKTQKWFPQRDLLMHPNIKLFITQGGLQSTDEAIDAGVPMVGLPMLGDQWYNVDKYVELGIGEYVDVRTMTSEHLIKAANKVIEDLRQNIRKLRNVINDQPQTALERAVWWTEHVLRHGGRHLRAPSANTSWAEYYMLDIVGILLSTVTVTFILIIYVCYKICRIYKRTFTRKSKQS